MTRIVTKPVMCESLLRFFLGTFLCVIPYLSALAEDYTEMHDGELNIQYIELEGNAFYPEYGLTQDVVKLHLKALHTTLGHKLKMKDIHNIADSVTLLYQEKGLTFHRVYVVPQEIKNSSLKLYVLKGKLAEIIIHNNSLYSKEQLLAPFKALIGQTIYEPYLKDAASKLSAKPGLKVFSYFSIGNKQGETRLNIRVLEESSSDTSITTVHVLGNPASIKEHTSKAKLLKVTDLLGRETKQTNQPLFYIYDDGTVEKRIVIE
mgnify:CR=1 FL=1